MQLTPERPDFGLCINVVTDERKSWPELRQELYGEDWEEVVADAIKAGLTT